MHKMQHHDDEFLKYSEELDAFYDMKEELFRRSRSVTAESKKIIFAIHRTDFSCDNSAEVVKGKLNCVERMIVDMINVCESLFAHFIFS